MAEIQIRPIDTPYFHAVPAPNGTRPRHAITTHVEGWDAIVSFAAKDPAFWSKFVDMYPRFVLHRDLKAINKAILECVGGTAKAALPYPSLQTAFDCVAFATRPNRPDGKDPISAEEVSVRLFVVDKSFIYAVIFPSQHTPLIMPFWATSGTGISSRLAEVALQSIELLHEVPLNTPIPSCLSDVNSIALQNRIAFLSDRAPASPRSSTSINDIYLFQTGMAAIYNVHKILRSEHGDLETIQFGVPFHQTRAIFQFWGPGFHFFPLATELDTLAKYVAQHRVLAIWTEMPLNPLLVSPDLLGLRAIASRHNIPLIIDDTIGSFSNIDVLHIADIVVTSLTKSFSGYADVMGGSAILNQDSKLYSTLKPLFAAGYHNNMFDLDAEVLVQNSNDYLTRSTVLNTNAQRLAAYLQTQANMPSSPVTTVFYPSLSPTSANYTAVMRPITAEFTPGYGCLLTVDFVNVECAMSFYNNLNFHQGPHLGAHRTLCVPYARAAYHEAMPAAEAWGLRESQIRISVGLEDGAEIVATVKHALKFAQEAMERAAYLI